MEYKNKLIQPSTFNFQSSEAGVTLLLAILIMAGLALITLAIGSFAIQELRASRAVAITEPAVTAAETGGEQGLWAVKRNTSLPTCPTLNTQTLTNNSLVTSCISYSQATFDLTAGVPYSFYLYDPNNPNGDTDLSGYPYQYLDVTHISGSNQVSINVERLPPPEGNSIGISPPTSSISPGESTRINFSPVTSGSEGRLKVTLTSSGSVTVSVTTDRGIPNIPTVDTLACSAKTSLSSCNPNNQDVFTRRIQVTIPK